MGKRRTVLPAITRDPVTGEHRAVPADDERDDDALAAASVGHECTGVGADVVYEMAEDFDDTAERMAKAVLD